MSYLPQQSTQHSLLSKTSSTRSCQSLICLTQRCREEEEKKQKQKMLNSIYFQKLSLKKFNANASTFNDTFLEKCANDKTIKRDKSTEDSDFQNIQLKTFGKQSQSIVSQQKYDENNQRLTSYSQYQNDRSTQRIIRSSSSSLRNNQPELKQIAECSMEREINVDLERIQHLSKLRHALQKEIQQLDSNIDKYYHVYNAKLQELKRIKFKLKQIQKEEQTQKALYKTPSTDNIPCGLFKKKTYPDEMPHLNHYQHQSASINRQQPKHTLQMNTLHSSIKNLNNNHGLQIVNQSPKYSQNNLTFIKKAS